MPFAPPWATDGTAVRDDYAAGLHTQQQSVYEDGGLFFV